METLIYFLIWAIVLFLIMRFGCGAHVLGHGRSHDGTTGDDRFDPDRRVKWAAPKKQVDPVCGQSVLTANAKSSVYDGFVFYFCSRDCREIFEAAPRTYLRPVEQQARTLEQTHV